MSPKRGERVAPPAVGDEWNVRFANNDAAKGWEELCRQAPENTRRAFESMRSQPRPNPATERHHRLKGGYASRDYQGRKLERWQIEVTGSGRIWYLIDDAEHTVWVECAGLRHPKATE
ncbi:hypothetical protein TH66_04565 [Carbonactinospora thermoautotrophica]|uniref:Cytotoxic translational repressor of toxin-antitoxin stability system n=1 Tax=Carbonactinospora thermoautotrophica TaxID=1469144 RepID=A0A132N4L7_9ACTN|nr:hypothetical protein [Carbonactinospora thermoautotrophica]KWX05033.1 hypothetical protein TH66_04565 [Carbonactinospora thermoautotrophica]KWX07214.1 hypothetical protein TR74_19450 [Carbonactinospora thermoautotrophica]